MTVHPTSENHPSHGRDTGAAFTGFIVGAIVIFCILFAIVKLTNAHYEHAESTPAESTQTPAAQAQ